ncbi:MAG: SGNH/GDSL hydrolase family protein [Clostridium sp.]|nr:SGNH/GDSL hydrolase family protein [Clostridium sp.]
MKSIRFITAIMLMALALGAMAQKKVSVLGDSYSTYGGAVQPETNLSWYNGPDSGWDKKNDVKEENQMWWSILCREKGLKMERNNSYSGSTVSCTGYGNKDYSDRAFITRVLNLGNPDIILVFGGTNDSWAKAPIGGYKYSDWTKEDLFTFRPAFAYMLHSLKEAYPQARIINITNSQLSDAVTKSMDEICGQYGVTNVQLHDIDKQMGHPSQAGMRAIAEQVGAAL